jgi:hypothetical protein
LGFGTTNPETRIKAQLALLNLRFRPVGFIFALGGITRDIVGLQYFENQGVAVGNYPPEVIDVRGRQRRGGLRDLNVYVIGPETIEGSAGYGASSWLVDVLNGTDPCQDYVLLPASALAPSKARSSKVVNLQGSTDFVAIGDGTADGGGDGGDGSFAQDDGGGDGGAGDDGAGDGSGGDGSAGDGGGESPGGDGGEEELDEEGENAQVEFKLPGAIGVFALQGNILAHQVGGGRRNGEGGEGGLESGEAVMRR